jgi:hypothetical protein
MTSSAKLPAEILINVVDFTTEKQALYQLCRTSKLFRAIAEPILYERHFRRNDLTENINIRILLQHSRFELIVNTISIKLERWKYCQRLQGFQTTRSGQCSCDLLDEDLGKGLRDLLNLKVLRLECSLCEVSSHKRHNYLSTLKTRVLQEINFDCFCSQMKKEMLTKTLGAPCMASVATLKWYATGVALAKKEFLEPFLANPDILPNLRHLHHRGAELYQLLLSHRPITRLSGDIILSSTLAFGDLMLIDDSLSHLSLQIGKGHFGQFLATVVRNPLPFRNLQHIGVFYLESALCSVSERSQRLNFSTDP